MNTDFKNSDDYRKLIQSQKDGLEEMSRHETNCPKSGDIMEECTCPQQSTVEERFDNLISLKFRLLHPEVISEIKSLIKSELQLAEQKAREEVLNSNEYKQLVEDAWKYNDLTK